MGQNLLTRSLLCEIFSVQKLGLGHLGDLRRGCKANGASAAAGGGLTHLGDLLWVSYWRLTRHWGLTEMESWVPRPTGRSVNLSMPRSGC